MAKYINNQRYWDCTLITLINATIFWNRVRVLPDSDIYQQFVKYSYGTVGACFSSYVNDVARFLGLKRIKGQLTLKWVRTHLPVEFTVFCHRGYHSVLCIAVKNNKLCLTNYSHDRLAWISWEKVKSMHNKRAAIEQLLLKVSN